ncbi:PaaX family transcriptional regulator C-terminal domain-containing protein [Thermomonospora umbrina]|uniref:PaaX family transcriptional regulator n=1 Tax=Thermomonospora umbrina TaxID=111806 RepID=A0A3D9SP33_9ACTN|nr:PaaX family transcriptional regulator C-terminal domain-containing protein [Thermomonospora umbrina]REE97668.1 PaaX family transcriptional regulator [Thermomonospora umbrina]
MIETLNLRPLTARSVVLSTLLGCHPPELRARHLVRVGEQFGIAEGTVRVALSRMVAAGDLVHVEGAYRLSERLLRRQARQDESVTPRTRAWDGGWEIAMITAERRPAPERTALRQAMAALRLAELREGAWLRPANLLRERPSIVAQQCTFLEGRPEGDPRELAAALWDLPCWAALAVRLQRALEEAQPLAERFTISAAVLRHLMTDPLLPDELLPETWPGPGLRARLAEFEEEFGRLLTDHAVAPRGRPAAESRSR